MAKYAAFDRKLLAFIADGWNTFSALHPRMAMQNMEGPDADYYRLTDRRLQALRKAGQISFGAGIWSVIPESPTK